MRNGGAEEHGTFFWQGTFIVLPVIILAAIGVFSLRQDRVLARHEAIERAQAVADELASDIWDELSRSNSAADSFAFEMDQAGSLLFPKSYAPGPLPHRFDSAQLNGEQARLWSTARAAELSAAHNTEAIAAYRKLIESGPPSDFRAASRYALGVLLEKEHQDQEAASNLSSLISEDPDAMGESGLPLAPMAELKLLGLANKGRGTHSRIALFERVCSNAVSQPTAISPESLRTAEQSADDTEEKQIVNSWRAQWEQHELERALSRRFRARFRGFTSAVREPAGITASWLLLPELDAQAERWLALVPPTGTNRWVHCLSEAVARQKVSAVVNARRVPDYLGVDIELAGSNLSPRGSRPHETRGGADPVRGEQTSTLLGSASPRDSGGGDLRVNVYLTSQAALFKRQNTRTFWFGALVAAAAVAALAGFMAAYRAFHRQLRLSEMKSNFVSSVSHELRAPIASVRLMAESLERGKVAERPRQQEYFRFIVQECRRLSALIENVLDFSRIEQGRKEYEFEPTDIVALTGQTVKLMEPYASERGVALVFEMNEGRQTAGAWDIAMDGKAIQQALINLIDNALKHSPKGQTVTVGVSLDANVGPPADSSLPPREALSGELQRSLPAHVQLWVEDHGEGIPPAEHEKIFERFYRRGSELRRETSGVGIGLSIVKHIVEAHCGHVAVRSDIGQGSRFTICLPLNRSLEKNPRT